jgi:hypothetical protein
MSTIWKDSLMAAFLALGTGLLLSPRRARRIAGLVALLLATATRYNALAMTLPIIALLFVWRPGQTWWKRYGIALATWVVITVSAQVVTRALTDRPHHLWHQSLALADMVGTLQYVDNIPDAELHVTLAGTGITLADHLHERMRIQVAPDEDFVQALWDRTNALWKRPRPPKLGEPPNWIPSAARREAITRAWRKIVLAHPRAYLTYRLQVMRQLLQLTDVPFGSAAYIWFNDIQDITDSANKTQHDATASRLQSYLHEAMWWLGETWLFHVYIYLFSALLLVPLAVRDRESLALLGSGLAGTAALYVLSPTTDFRYCFWLVVSTVLAVAMLIARRARPQIV